MPDNLSAKEMAQEYGYQLKFFKQSPELWHMLQRATKNNWTAQKFAIEFQQTKWFKNHSSTYREAMHRKIADPESFKREVDQKWEELQQLAAQYGSKISYKWGRGVAERAILYGHTDLELRDFLSRHVRPGKGGHFGGSLASVEEQVRQTAFRNGIRLSQKSMNGWMRRIVSGQTTMENYNNWVRTQAQRTWKAYAHEIKAGADLIDLADPYIQSMREILELPPEEVDLFSPKIRRALSHKNAKGETDPMSLVDFENSLRDDPRWRHTQNASDTLSEAAFGLVNKLGLRAG